MSSTGPLVRKASSSSCVYFIKLELEFNLQAKASNETQKRANDSKSDGMQRSGADALGGVINKVHTILRKVS